MSELSGLAKRLSAAYPNTETRAILEDCLFLISIIVASIIFYLPGLGFYSDDWIFLSLLHLSDDQSLRGLFQALYEGDVVIRQRPFQMVYLVLAYRLSGLEPIYYHLANATALIANGILLYLVVRKFGQNRLIAVVIPLIYLLLPHYSTDRFWIAAHQATFSISFYLLSLYADLHALHVYPHHWRWKFLGLVTLVLSGLAYEVAIPLLVINPLLVWYCSPQTYRSTNSGSPTRIKFIMLFAANFLALLVIVGFKALVTVRTNIETDLLSHLVFLVTGALRVNFITYGLGLPYIISWILSHQPDWTLIAAAGVVGIFVLRYLYSISMQSEYELWEKNKWWTLILLGMVIFALGYAIFTFNADLWFTSTSLGNRVAIAAAIGIAMIFTGAAGWFSNLLPKRWTRAVFCSLIALLSSSGFLIINTLASFWVTTYQEQQVVLKAMQENMPLLPSNSILLLDGVCAEHGGAYLFTGKRDLTSSLRMIYHDQSLNATVLSSTPQIEETGLSVLTYRREDLYPYGESLFIYDFREQELYPLNDANTARQYFERTDFVPEQDCPPGFAWGRNDQ